MTAILPQHRWPLLTAAWFDRGVLVAVLLACGVAYSLNVADPDLWGHIQYGRDALRSGLPATTTYSYIAEGYPWVNHEILAELALALGNDYLGGRGLMIIKCLLGVGGAGLMILHARRQKVGLLATAMVALLVSVCLSNHWSMRPQLISYSSFAFLLALLTWCFEKWDGTWQLAFPWKRAAPGEQHPALDYAVDRLKFLWLVPILMIVWTNSHGGFLAGYAVFVAYLGLRGVEAFCRMGRNADGLILRFGVMIVAAGLATFINPYGLNFHLWLFDDLKVPRPEIIEWRSPDLTDAQNVPFILLAATWLATLVISRKPRDFTHLVILGLILWQSLAHLRHIAFFAIALGFWLPPHLDSLLQRFRISRPGESPADGLSPLYQRLSIVGLLVAWIFCGVQMWSQIHHMQVERGSYPVAAFEYIGQQNLRGRMVCTFNWAQYALAAFGPRDIQEEGILVHVDGRCRTSYSQAMLDEHFDFVMGEVPADMRYRGPDSGPFDPRRVLTHGQPDLVVVSRLQEPSVKVMNAQRDRWVVLYQDELAQVWGRTSKYGDPRSPHFIPLERRVIGNAKQAGFAEWPALPKYDRGTKPQFTSSQLELQQPRESL